MVPMEIDIGHMAKALGEKLRGIEVVRLTFVDREKGMRAHINIEVEEVSGGLVGIRVSKGGSWEIQDYTTLSLYPSDWKREEE